MSRRRGWTPGLRERLVAAVLLVLAGLLVVNASLVVMRSERALVDAQQERFTGVTRQLAETIRYPVLARSEVLLAPSLEVFAHTPDLVQVEVRDEKRGLLAVKSGARGPLAEVLDRTTVVEVEVPILTLGDAPGDDGGELETFGLTADSPQLIGRVTAMFSTESTARIQRRLRWEIIAAFTLVGTLGLLAVFWLASSVVRRAQKLADAAAQVARGDLEVHVDDRGEDELSALARDFNAMTGALAEQHRALDAAADQLAEQESLSAIGRATAVIAHELKNPLGILLGAAQIAANEQRPEVARSKAAQIIAEEVQRLERTLNELLHDARPRQPSRSEIDALALCQQARARATHPGGPAEHTEVRVQGASQRVLVDEQQASQIVLNLLTNAAQAGARQVEITIVEVGQRVQLIVCDDGPGIDPAIREQLFRPFVTTKQRGAGLGLAGSRRMARDNGGDLTLEPAERGARFVLALQRAGEQEPPP